MSIEQQKYVECLNNVLIFRIEPPRFFDLQLFTHQVEIVPEEQQE